MRRSSVKKEVNGAISFYMREYCMSREEAKVPTAEMYVYLYLHDGMDINELVEILNELRDDTTTN